ncbi:MAG: hypothetical protein ACJ8EH_04555 [Sphingomicrobium sp.]
MGRKADIVQTQGTLQSSEFRQANGPLVAAGAGDARKRDLLPHNFRVS